VGVGGARSRVCGRGLEVVGCQGRVFLGDVLEREALIQVVENDRESPAFLDPRLSVTDVRICRDVTSHGAILKGRGRMETGQGRIERKKGRSTPFWTYRVSVAGSSDGKA